VEFEGERKEGRGRRGIRKKEAHGESGLGTELDYYI